MIDEEHDDGLGGRGRDRREVTRANRWARPLCALTSAELAAAPLPELVREQVRLARSVKTARARNRELQRIDKLIRAMDPEEIGAVDAFLADPEAGRRVLEGWVDRLVAEGDAASELVVAANPGVDRQRLRNLVRNARSGEDRPKAALYQALVEIEDLILPS